MHPVKVFSNKNSKNKSLAVHANKENKGSVTESFHKKFSIGSHGLSEDIHLFNNKKSIADEKISVCLDKSQNKTYAFEKRSFNSHNQLQYLNYILENNDDSLLQILNRELKRDDTYSQEMKKIICTLLEKLEDEKQDDIVSDQNKNTSNFQLDQHVIVPYLEQEILMLQKNLDTLRKREEDLEKLGHLNKSQKNYLLVTLTHLQQEQEQQLAELLKEQAQGAKTNSS